jgi:hypothetical protein
VGDVPGGSIVPSDDHVDGEGIVNELFVLFGGGCACNGLGGGCGHCLGSFCTGSGIFVERSGTGTGIAGATVSLGVSVSSLPSESLSGEGEEPVKVSKKAESRKLEPI